MPNRRKVLIGIGTVGSTVSLAGCLENPEITLFVEDRDGKPVEDAQVEIGEETGVLDSYEVVEVGVTNNSGEFSTDLGGGEYIIKTSHTVHGSEEINAEIENDFEETIVLFPDLVLTVTNSEGEPIEGAEVEIIEEGGTFSGDSVIQTGTTDSSGEFIKNFDDGEGHLAKINHPDYFEDELSLEGSPEHTIELREFDPTLHAARVINNVLTAETDFDRIREIDVSDLEEGITVEASSNWEAFRATESAYAGKAADVLEGVFASDADIHYFEIELYGPTVDEYGNEGFSRALTVGMYEETANQINWDNYDSDNLSRHADTYNLNIFLF